MNGPGPADGVSTLLKELRARAGTGNAWPLLAEIAEALGRLIETGDPTIIDLGALPFGAGDERVLDEVLGDGEVQATLSALGESRVSETGVAGVWRIDHYDQAGETLSRFIEITFVPEILKSQSAEAEEGLVALLATLAARGTEH